MRVTESQLKAVVSRGNVLVVAGAGTGKTHTLVERCLNCLIHEQPRVSIDEILMVTFTEKAAAEMQGRIRKSIGQHAEKNPSDVHCAGQLALFETAHIGTLHSFCLRLVQQNFYSLKLDPQLTVLSAEETALHAKDAFDKVLQRHYSGKSGGAVNVQKLIQVHGRGSDLPIRRLVLQLHHYTQTLPDPQQWFENQLAMFASEKPDQWETWLVEAVKEWRKDWPSELLTRKAPVAAVAVLEKLSQKPSRADCAAALARICADKELSSGEKKSPDAKLLEKFFAEAAFLDSLANAVQETDPLAEDWNWVREQMAVLLLLAQEFGTEFSETKRELGVLDFHDLEQFALDLLWDRSADKPTELARQWRQKLRFVFVDEYQDINAAQDKIIAALSRDGERGNRFLVGDAKQSIYRFRLADPSIFRRYIGEWSEPRGKILPLADNFRSRESILIFANSLFAALMKKEIGGIAYDKSAALQFGAAEERKPLSRAADTLPRVELHLKIKGASDAYNSESDDESSASRTLGDLAEVEAEARIIAIRLRKLKEEPHQVWDDDKKDFRPVNWRDMAILLRAPANKTEVYAKEFQRAGVPLFVARGGFFESIEVLDLLNLLSLLDNPLQDLPALAVLRSPLIGLTSSELALIRLAQPRGQFWHAIHEFHRGKSAEADGAWRKVDLFLKRFRNWRRLARQSSLSRCLEAVIGETFYESWVLTQPRKLSRQANIRRFLGLAQQFDRFKRQGLFRFLKFIEAQQLAEAEPEFPASTSEDAVRLMSIHQSKGLQFPVVVVADLGKGFNEQDLRNEIILDEKFGVCPHVRPPHTGRTYPSLPYWLAKRRQKRELLGEELRLLYVAVTRARDTLILSGAVTQKKVERWNKSNAVSTVSLLGANSFADFLGLWLSSIGQSVEPSTRTGENEFLRWFFYTGGEHQSVAENKDESARSDSLLGSDDWQKVLQRLSSWKYPHLPATAEPAKTSVTFLRKRYAEEQELATPFSRAVGGKQFAKQPVASAPTELSTTERGSAHHAFLELISLDCAGSVEELKREAVRLERDSLMQLEQIQSLDFAALAVFWQSALGKRIRANAAHVRRELAFTSRFSPADLAKLVGTKLDATLEGEFVVVQGVADLVVILANEIWLVDFKTDELTPTQLEEKKALYEPQLLFYAAALERIYKKRVTEVWLHFLSLQKSERIAM